MYAKSPCVTALKARLHGRASPRVNLRKFRTRLCMRVLCKGKLYPLDQRVPGFRYVKLDRVPGSVVKYARESMAITEHLG